MVGDDFKRKLLKALYQLIMWLGSHGPAITSHWLLTINN